jgi:hypothetical protein
MCGLVYNLHCKARLEPQLGAAALFQRKIGKVSTTYKREAYKVNHKNDNVQIRN